MQTRENIDRYCEKFEKDMLYLFDRSYRKGEPKIMHVRPLCSPPRTRLRPHSTAHKRSSISMVGARAYRCM
jgi:hypothetical protein